MYNHHSPYVGRLFDSYVLYYPISFQVQSPSFHPFTSLFRDPNLHSPLN